MKRIFETLETAGKDGVELESGDGNVTTTELTELST